VLRNLGEDVYDDESSSGDLGLELLCQTIIGFTEEGAAHKPSWEHLQKVVNSARMTS
jgi:hypothetical protein